MIDYLNVNEVFGVTLQGEGPNTGQLASFLRLAGCNLSCSWCDTPYTWDWARYDRHEETKPTSIDELVDIFTWTHGTGRIVVSGGEPLLQHHGLAEFIRRYRESDRFAVRPFDLETNGTRPLGDTLGLWDTIVTSPKVGGSAEQGAAGLAIHPEIIEHADAFKFVVDDARDLSDVLGFVEEHKIPHSKVWLMPQGTTAAEIMARTPFVVDHALGHRFNFSTRLHTLIWDTQRGV